MSPSLRTDPNVRNTITDTINYTYASTIQNLSTDLNIDSRRTEIKNTFSSSSSSSSSLCTPIKDLAEAGGESFSVDYTQQVALRLNVTPDVFIVPSVVKHFIRV
jgi:hypothetical protein